MKLLNKISLSVFLLFSMSMPLSAQQTIADYSLFDYQQLRSISASVENETFANLTDKDVLTAYIVDGFSDELWIQLETKDPVIVKGYALVPADDALCDPRNFTLEGSNDGQAWTRIGLNVIGQNFKDRYVPVLISQNSNKKAYAFHRIVITKNNGGSQLKLSELQLFGYPEALQQDLTKAEGVLLTGEFAGSSSNVLSNLQSDDLALIFRQEGTKKCWMQYEFANPVKVNGYSLIGTTYNKPDDQVCSWILSASNDEENWNVIDARSNKAFFNMTNNQQVYSLSGKDKRYDWAAYADTLQRRMIDMFWKSYGTGMYLTHSYHTNPDSINEGFNYWWMAHVVDVFTDGYLRTENEVYQTRMTNIYNGMLTYGRRVYGRNDLWNGFFDDMEWMGIASLRASQTYPENSIGNKRFKDAAVQLWDWIKVGWNDHHGGGIQWVDAQPTSKNACSNAPALILAARLYNETADEEYLNWAVRIYDWMAANLIFPENGLVKDSYGNDEYGWTLTYNQGTWIGACLELYNITGEQKYYDAAMRTADYVVNNTEKFSPFGILYNNEGGGDGGLFKGIFMRYLSQWILSGKLDKEREQRFTAYFLENGKSVWDSAISHDTGIVGNKWYERRAPIQMLDRKGSGYDAAIHLSAVMLFELLDELQRNGYITEDNRLPAEETGNNEYKYYRLEIIANNGGQNIELARWQLFDNLKEDTNLPSPSQSPLPVNIYNGTGKVTIENLTDSKINYLLYMANGQMAGSGLLLETTELNLPQGVYILLLADDNKGSYSTKVVVK